jgi:hypothetical protein
MTCMERLRSTTTLTLSILAGTLFAPAVTSQHTEAVAQSAPATAASTSPDSLAAEAHRRFEAATRRTERLFGPQEPLEFTLISDYRTLFRDRDTLSTKKFKARMIVKDSAGRERTFDMLLNTRGHYRLRASNCPFPPIKLNFETGTSGTPFQGQDGIKLGTHCRPDSDEYAEYVIREYLAYRTYNILTNLSLRARLARVTYVDSTGRDKPVTTWGLLIEDEDDAARRNMGNISEIRGRTFSHVDPTSIALVGLFEYFIGNADWSLPALHNIRVIEPLNQFPRVFAYDFDWSGLVSTRYATPDPRLGIRSVRDRLYRGPCMSPNDLHTLLELFRSKRADILKLYEETKGLDPEYMIFVRNFFADFFRTIENPALVQQAIVSTCREIGT